MSPSDHLDRLPYRLGLPAWAFPGWQGPYFRRSQPALADYARVFNSVEGNTTFYRVPTPPVVEQWRRAVSGTDFHFCFKLPRTVTHERRPVFDDLDAFLQVIEPLGDHLGPLLLQFPERIGPDALDQIEGVLQRLPAEQPIALEVRHPAFFEQPQVLEPLLEQYSAGRISMDTRAMYGGDMDHPDVRNRRHEKPDLPVLDSVYNALRFVRLVLHPSGQGNQACLDQWAHCVADDIAAGRQSYLFIHCPNNLHCPEFALQFHQTLLQRTPLPPLSGWPAQEGHQQTLNLGI